MISSFLSLPGYLFHSWQTRLLSCRHKSHLLLPRYLQSCDLLFPISLKHSCKPLDPYLYVGFFSCSPPLHLQSSTIIPFAIENLQIESGSMQRTDGFFAFILPIFLLSNLQFEPAIQVWSTERASLWSWSGIYLLSYRTYCTTISTIPLNRSICITSVFLIAYASGMLHTHFGEIQPQSFTSDIAVFVDHRTVCLPQLQNVSDAQYGS